MLVFTNARHVKKFERSLYEKSRFGTYCLWCSYKCNKFWFKEACWVSTMKSLECQPMRHYILSENISFHTWHKLMSKGFW